MNEIVTMAQIAARAGVHVTTVSLALRNHPSLPERTRERIRRLAEEMGYRPDPTLRALMTYRKNCRKARQVQTLGYVTNWDSRWVWKSFPAHAAFHEGAEKRALELGYQLEHFWLGEPQLSGRRLGDILHARGISGVLLASQRFDRDDRLDLDWTRLSAVKIDYYPHEPQLHTVTNDQRSIVRRAVRQVVAAGYRRVGLVLHRDWDRGVDAGLTTGYLEAQQALPAECRLPVLFIEKTDPPPDEKWGGRVPLPALSRWLKSCRPDAVIGFGPAVRTPLEELRAIPEKIGFADLFLTQTDGSVAGVRHNCRQVGELAIDLLAGQLQLNKLGLPPFPTSTLVDGTWFDGATLPPRR
ncbi:MAG: LacI family DNA-binding transcriptional regulator [Opitutaceae bacterium]